MSPESAGRHNDHLVLLFRHHLIKKWPAPNYKGKHIKMSEGGGSVSGRYLLNISVKMGNIYNVNLTAIKTSVSLSECRVQGGLACKSRHMGGNSIYQHLSTQSDPILSNHSLI